MGTEVFRIWKDNRCNFVITDYAPEQRKSSHICGSWAGSVDQFKNNETVLQIKESAKTWLKREINKKHDGQYSSKETYKWLLLELEYDNQLTFDL